MSRFKINGLVLLFLLAAACGDTDDEGGSSSDTADAQRVERSTPDAGSSDLVSNSEDTGSSQSDTSITPDMPATPDESSALDTGMGQDETTADSSGTQDVATEDVVSDSTGSGEGACDNTDDLASLEANESELEDIISGCIFSCMMTGGDCMQTCFETDLDLSSGCATCFAEVSQCTLTNCPLQCATPGSEECATCRGTSCDPAFIECSGIAPT